MYAGALNSDSSPFFLGPVLFLLFAVVACISL